MAKPIEPTPLLEGRDAEKFLMLTESISFSPEKEAFLKECDKIYQRFRKE